MPESRPPRFDPAGKASFKTYVYRMAKNTLIDFLRREKRAEKKGVAYGKEVAQQPPRHVEESKRIEPRKLVLKLEKKEERIVMGLLLADFTQIDIAEILDVAPATVTNWKQRAENQLAERYRHENGV